MNPDNCQIAIKRRDFIKRSSLFGGTLLLWPSDFLSAFTGLPVAQNLNVDSAIHTKLNILPVIAGIVHNAIYEGPCRYGGENPPGKEEEREKNIELINRFNKEWQAYSFHANVNMMDPVYFEYDDTWIIDDSQWDKLDNVKDTIDVFFFAEGSGIAQVPAVQIGERFKKPVVFYGGGPHNKFFPEGVDAVSHLRASNLEGFVVFDEEELDGLFHLMQARKAIHNTRILRIIDYKTNNVNGNFMDLDHLKNKFGIDAIDLRIKDMVDEFDHVANDRQMMKEVHLMANKLIDNAEVNHMNNEKILPSVIFYFAASSLMVKHNCNAFTIHCFEICPDQRLCNERESTPCLTHTLLRDCGIPSACEADMNLLMSVMAGLYIGQRSMFMGNLFVKDRANNILEILHDVPGLKMKGFDMPDLPYEIKNMTYGGFGVTVRYDFNRDKGQPVTIARFSPSGHKILVTGGEIVGGEGVDWPGCNLRAYIKIRDINDFFHKAADFGNHSIMLYGSYTGQFKKLGQLMDFEVIEA